MIATALDRLIVSPVSKLLGWHLLDARPKQGWVRIGFDGKAEFCNPAGFIQGGILTAMLDDTMGPRLMTADGSVLATATTSARLVETAKAISRERRDVAAVGV